MNVGPPPLVLPVEITVVVVVIVGVTISEVKEVISTTSGIPAEISADIPVPAPDIIQALLTSS